MTNIIIQNKTFWNVFMVCNNYYIPSDVSKIIYELLLHISAKNIIDKWYSYVNIHNTNLVKLVLNLKKKYYYSNITGQRNIYYNITDINVYNTFKIFIKYFKPCISSKDWWIEHIRYLLNGFNVYNYYCLKHFSIYKSILLPVLQILHKLN